MNRFIKRRILALTLTTLACGVLGGAAWLVKQRLGHASVLTGSTALACLFLLLLIGVRRRIPVLPLWSMSTWVQIHIYMGLFSVVAYVMHVPALIASGTFEGGLSLLFLAVAASGLYGLYVSRTAPKRLTAVAGEYRFEQIGWHRTRIAELADELIEELSGTQAATVLSRFYLQTLQPFFGARPSLAYVAVPTGGRRRRILTQLRELDRYLEVETRDTAGRFAALVRMRDDLDYHFALQLRLRGWLVIHSLLSTGLVIWASTHALLALRFLG
ncbi:hypothetical protein [Roseimaritima ulvae]|uniref:Ferric reductase like transmembrane component n=1 Tax=Roseimaritima ulvae TaxID=980254 RepID=A0A5B9QMS0_9BACT|nr:hypothetical protein [Roseimaritima ulvae]QEG40288.1 hypothetical protein UC8_22950 [Roseimaritima ulvae]